MNITHTRYIGPYSAECTHGQNSQPILTITWLTVTHLPLCLNSELHSTCWP